MQALPQSGPISPPLSSSPRAAGLRHRLPWQGYIHAFYAYNMLGHCLIYHVICGSRKVMKSDPDSGTIYSCLIKQVEAEVVLLESDDVPAAIS